MNLKLNQLRAFAAVASLGSIRGAARELGISQPSLTRAVRELEESLGEALVVRHHSGASLTPAGQALAEHARLILSQLERAQESVRQFSGSRRGRVGIGLSATVARLLLPEVIARFRADYPSIALSINEGQLSMMGPLLRGGEIDFAINTVFTASLDQDLTAQWLFDRRFRLVVRKGHPLAGSDRLDDFARCDWVVPHSRSGYYRELEELLTSRGILRETNRITSDSFNTGLNVIAQSDIVGVFAEGMALAHGLAGVVEVALDEALPIARFYAVRLRDAPITPAAAALLRLFERTCLGRNLEWSR